MKSKFKLDKKRLFWITGLSGSGKSTVAKNIQKNISKNYGKSVLINGDKLRDILKIKGCSQRRKA